MHTWSGGLLSQPQQPETPVERAAIATSTYNNCVGYRKDSESADVIHKHLYPESVEAVAEPSYPKSPLNPRGLSVHVHMYVYKCSWGMCLEQNFGKVCYYSITHSSTPASHGRHVFPTPDRIPALSLQV